ncbi:MAG: hypothetical protein V4582_13655 [Pseudomonadota bacterium]
MRQLNKKELPHVSAAADTVKVTCLPVINGGTTIQTCQTVNNTTITTVCTTAKVEVSFWAKLFDGKEAGGKGSGDKTTCTQTTIDKNGKKTGPDPVGDNNDGSRNSDLAGGNDVGFDLNLAGDDGDNLASHEDAEATC